MIYTASHPLRLPAFLTQGLLILAFITTLFSMGLGCGQAVAQTTAAMPTAAMPCHNTSQSNQMACIKICMTSLEPHSFAPQAHLPTHKTLWHPISIAFLETTLRPDVPPPRL